MFVNFTVSFDTYKMAYQPVHMSKPIWWLGFSYN